LVGAVYHEENSISVAEVELIFGQALNHMYVLVASNNALFLGIIFTTKASKK
jgi:hypothetical protein